MGSTEPRGETSVVALEEYIPVCVGPGLKITNLHAAVGGKLSLDPYNHETGVELITDLGQLKNGCKSR